MPPSLGIAGVGLIGGSIALRAARLGWRVALFDTDPEHRRIARERLGAACEAASLADLADRCSILVLAAPLEATLAQLRDLAAALPANVELVLDVASVKAPVAAAGARVRGFVPSHPIAGSERSGPHAARADLFEGRAWSFEPAVPDEARERATRFIEAMGALPVAIASLEHDRVVALTSHLPQLVSVALGAALEPALREARTSALCGTGVRSMLRLAGSSWTVWRAVLEANAIPIAQEVRRLAAILTGVAEALEDGDAALLERRFGEAAGAAASLRAPHDER